MPADATVSTLVCTMMPVPLPGVAAPIVKPLRVMVKGKFAGIPTAAVVTTIIFSVMADEATMVATDVEPTALG